MPVLLVCVRVPEEIGNFILIQKQLRKTKLQFHYNIIQVNFYVFRETYAARKGYFYILTYYLFANRKNIEIRM